MAEIRTIPPRWTKDEVAALMDHSLNRKGRFLINQKGGLVRAIDQDGTILHDDAGLTAVWNACVAECIDGDAIDIANAPDPYVGDISISKRLTVRGENTVGPTIEGTVSVDSDYVSTRDFIVAPGLLKQGFVLGTNANYGYHENIRASNALNGLYKAPGNVEGICNLISRFEARSCKKGALISYVDGAMRFNSNVFLRSSFNDNIEDGFVICDGAVNTLIGCDFENNGRHGLDFQSVRTLKIDQGYFEHNAQEDGDVYSEVHGKTNATAGAPFNNIVILDACDFTAQTYAENTINFESRVSRWELRNCNIINTGRTYSIKTAADCTYALIGMVNKVKPNSLGTNVGVIELEQLIGTTVARSPGYVSAENNSVFNHNLGKIPTNFKLTQKRSPIIAGTSVSLEPTVLTFDENTFTIAYLKFDVAAGTLGWVDAADAREIYWEAIYQA